MGGMGGMKHMPGQKKSKELKAMEKKAKKAAKKALENADFNDVGKTALDTEEALPPHVVAWRKEHTITVAGNCPLPLLTFESAGLAPAMLMAFTQAGFTSPSAIQAQSWPAAMQNRDVIGVAKTGSGKTLGFLVPCFTRLLSSGYNVRLGPYGLVLAPTRELAVQIQVARNATQRNATHHNTTTQCTL